MICTVGMMHLYVMIDMLYLVHILFVNVDVLGGLFWYVVGFNFCLEETRFAYLGVSLRRVEWLLLFVFFSAANLMIDFLLFQVCSFKRRQLYLRKTKLNLKYIENLYCNCFL